MKMKFLSALTGFALAFGLAAGASAQDVHLRLGSPVGPQDLATKYLEDYAKRVSERTEGKLTLEVIPIETLGFKNVDSLRVVRQNVVDAIYVQTFYVTRDEPLMSAFMPHGVLTESKENLKVTQVQFEVLQAMLRDKWNMELVTNDPTGGGQSRLYIASKEPINTLEQLKAVKLRHYSKAGIRAYSELGVSAQVVPSSELYLALQTGVVDSAVYGAPYIISQSINEVTCCAAYVGALTLTPRGIAVDADKWSSLPESYKKAMVDVGKEMLSESMEIWQKDTLEQGAVDKLVASGYQILDDFPIEDRLKIQDATLSVWHADVVQIGPEAVDMYDKIVKALKAGN